MVGLGTTEQGTLLHRRIDGTPEAVRGHLETLETVVRDQNIDPERCGDVLIVLAEVLNNIVEHAFHDVPAGWIDCRVVHAENRFSIVTKDNGSPLPPRLLSAGPPPDVGTDPEDLPEGGFGWFIVHALANDMLYERTQGCNQLSFSLEID